MHPRELAIADFTYELPESLRHRVKPGARVLVPFGSRKLIGVALDCHEQSPDHPARTISHVESDRWRCSG